MRVRRSIPQKPLTEEQKARAIEAQKQVQKLNGGPLTANQAYQNYPSAAPSMMQRFQTNMRQNPFMRNRMTFEEKYGVRRENNQLEGTSIENLPIVDDDEGFVVPPSLEEDANQSSPLPPDVVNVSEVSDLDAYIQEAEKLKQENTEATRDIYEAMDLKGLKAAYIEMGGTRDISHNNNKNSIINLIMKLIEDGTQKKETDGTTNG